MGWFERTSEHVYYHMWNRSPVQVGCMRQGAQGWCTGMTQRDGTGEGGGRGVQDGEHMYTHGWFMSMYGKNNYNSIISLQLNKFFLDVKNKNKMQVRSFSEWPDSNPFKWFHLNESKCQSTYKCLQGSTFLLPNPYLSDLYSNHSHLAHYVLTTIVFCFSYMPWTLSPYKLYTGCFFFLVHSYLRHALLTSSLPPNPCSHFLNEA